MVRITFVEHGGDRHIVDVEPGMSLMKAARVNDVPGIKADCGGNCACATCHVYIDTGLNEQLAGPSASEREMLKWVCEPAIGSRLSCQIAVCELFEGSKVQLPSRQM